MATPIKLNRCLESCELSVRQEEIKAMLVAGKNDYTAKKYCFALHKVHDVLHFHIFLSFPLTHRRNICAISALGLHHLPPASSSLSYSTPSAGLLTHTSSFSPHHPIHHASSFGFFLFCFFAESCAYNVIGLSLPLSPSQGSSCIKSSFPPCFALLIWPCRPE